MTCVYVYLFIVWLDSISHQIFNRLFIQHFSWFLLVFIKKQNKLEIILVLHHLNADGLSSEISSVSKLNVQNQPTISFRFHNVFNNNILSKESIDNCIAYGILSYIKSYNSLFIVIRYFTAWIKYNDIMIDSNNSFRNQNSLITFLIRFKHDKADVIVDVLINLKTTLLS